MPIINPRVQDALRMAGLTKEKPEGESSDLRTALEQGGFSRQENIQRLLDLADGAGTDTVKLRALEMAWKLIGELEDKPAQQPVFNIIINDSKKPVEGTLNPILIPRQSAVETLVQ